MILATKENYLLKISYLDFIYQNKLVSKLVSNLLLTYLVTNYYFLFIIVTILIINNFLFCKLVSKLVTIVVNYFLFLKLFFN